MSMIHAKVPLVYKNIYVWFVKTICSATPNGVATHSLRSPVLVDIEKKFFSLSVGFSGGACFGKFGLPWAPTHSIDSKFC